MYFKKWLLSEMPITTFQTLGKWDEKDRPYRWDKKSIRILTSEKAIQKIKKQWENTDYEFDLYFLRAPKVAQHTETGLVDPEFVSEILKQNIEANPDRITIIFVGNVGDEKVPMTAWIIAHRFAHAVQATNRRKDASLPLTGRLYGIIKNPPIHSYLYFEQELKRYMNDLASHLFGKQPKPYSYNKEYEDFMLSLAQHLGTFRSARNRKIARLGEFAHELFAQYLLTGKIKFNKIDKSILGKKGSWGRQNYYSTTGEDWNDLIEEMESSIEYLIDGVLGQCINKIFVM